MSDKSIRLTTDQIIKLYERAKKLGGWKKHGVVSQIEREAPKIIGSTISRPSIYKMLKLTKYKAPIREPRVVEVEPKYVKEYKNTDLYKKLLEDYPDPLDPTKINKTGANYSRVGLDLFLHYGKRDPTTVTLKEFREAFNWDQYVDTHYLEKYRKRQPTFEKASALRNVMVYAGFDPDAYKWTSTKGLKRPPKRIYLEETELIGYIYGIEEPDTLVLARIGFEGGGRFSATSQIKTVDVAWGLNQIKLIETKTDTFPVKPFRPCTMNFIRDYIKQFGIKGKLFRWDYKVYEDRLTEAGRKAGIWRYERDALGNIVYEEKLKTVKGKRKKFRYAVIEGKKTTSHLMKHTFVSLGSLHGLSYETLSDITATDIGTLKKWYMGTGRKKTLSEVHGKVEYLPYWDWIDKVMNPHWTKRYDQIKDKSIKVDGIVTKGKALTTRFKLQRKQERKRKKKKAKAPFNWEAIKGMAYSPIPKTKKLPKSDKTRSLTKAEIKQQKNIRATWKKALALHNKGLSDAQVRKEMGWA